MPFSVNTGTLEKLASSLLRGDVNAIETIVEKKIEAIGKNVLLGLIASSPIGAGLGVAERAAEIIGSLGESELADMRQEWLNSIRPSPIPGSNIFRGLQRAINNSTKRPKKNWPGSWAESRQQWLDERWRHNWQ